MEPHGKQSDNTSPAVAWITNKHMKKVIITFCAAVLLAVSVTGCNTVRGAGEDVERAGEAVRDAVN